MEKDVSVYVLMQENDPHLRLQASIHELKRDQVAGAFLETAKDKLAKPSDINGTSLTWAHLLSFQEGHSQREI